jgi:hypothetical protein
MLAKALIFSQLGFSLTTHSAVLKNALLRGGISPTNVPLPVPYTATLHEATDGLSSPRYSKMQFSLRGKQEQL